MPSLTENYRQCTDLPSIISVYNLQQMITAPIRSSYTRFISYFCWVMSSIIMDNISDYVMIQIGEMQQIDRSID